MLRTWRDRRRMSQLDLASVAEVSTRHLSYVETGRSTPSRELVLHLARHLDVPLREQNDLLLAAGHAPAHTRLDLADPDMAPVMATIQTMLAASEPNPALVMDRHWNLVAANDSAFGFLGDVAEHLLGPPLNVLRLTLHPDGLAQRIDNLADTSAHLIHRLRRQVAITGDPALVDLLAEAESLAPLDGSPVEPNDRLDAGPMLPVTIRDGDSTSTTTYLSVISTFGSALDVTASELTIETFYIVN